MKTKQAKFFMHLHDLTLHEISLNYGHRKETIRNKHVSIPVKGYLFRN